MLGSFGPSDMCASVFASLGHPLNLNSTAYLRGTALKLENMTRRGFCLNLMERQAKYIITHLKYVTLPHFKKTRLEDYYSVE